MSLKTPIKYTDKERGIVTIKLSIDVRDKLREFTSKYRFKKYDEAILDLISVYENFIDRFIQEYTKSLNKCKECQYRNTEVCKTKCQVRMAYSHLEKCQSFANEIFDVGIRFIDNIQNILDKCKSCDKVGTKECLKCKVRLDFRTIELMLNRFKQIINSEK